MGQLPIKVINRKKINKLGKLGLASATLLKSKSISVDNQYILCEPGRV
jgi:hypothetical protein